MYGCYLFIFSIHHFSLNRTAVAAKQRCVTQRQDGVRKFQCCFKETCPGVTTIFQKICIVSCKKCKQYCPLSYSMASRARQQIVSFGCSNDTDHTFENSVPTYFQLTMKANHKTSAKFSLLILR